SLGDIFGGKRIFELGVAAFGVTSILCAISLNGPELIIARGLQGIAGALPTPAALATITANFSGEERGAAIGTWTAWTGISFLLGPLVGGWLVSVGSWRSIFVINIPFVIATLVLVRISLPNRDTTRERAHVDIVGGVLGMLGLGGPVFALIESQKR